MLILGIESTCDETAAAVVEDGVRVRSNVVATQIELHRRYRGVVPEIASRAHIENILPVLREAVAEAGCTLADLDAIAVAHRPGLIGSLLIGVTAAKSLAWALGRPLVGVDHVHAHLYSVALKDEGGRMKDETETAGPPSSDSSLRRAQDEAFTLHPSSFPALGLVCSGGHTALYALNDWLDVRLIGSTIDDAVGEAYDKVAALLGLAYPGGPVIDRLARQGDPRAIDFPRSLLGRESLDFSFSGLKTAVLYHVRGVPTKDRRPAAGPVTLDERELADLAASFQAACVDVIVRKLKRAAKAIGARSVIVGGGVSANRGLRAALADFPLPAHFPELAYCTDNAAMSAGLAHLHLAAGRASPLDLDAIPFSQFVEPPKRANG